MYIKYKSIKIVLFIFLLYKLFGVLLFIILNISYIILNLSCLLNKGLNLKLQIKNVINEIITGKKELFIIEKYIHIGIPHKICVMPNNDIAIQQKKADIYSP